MMECFYLKDLYNIEFVNILKGNDNYKNKVHKINICNILYVKWMVGYKYLENQI